MEFYFHHTDGDVIVLTADGGLTPDNVLHFMGELEKIIDGGVQKVIIDCTKLTYVSNWGLYKLLRQKSDLAELGGQIRLACVCGRLAKILIMLGLNERFDLYPDVNTARGSFGDIL